jgi:alkaline phosphatase D
MTDQSRRGWLAHAAGLGVAGLSGACTSMQPVTPARGGTGHAPGWRGATDPFSLGVASGWPRPDGATIWTRLAPQPLQAGGGVDPVPISVQWEVFEEGRAAVVQSGRIDALPDWAHSVRVDVRGLQPHRRYRYRFMSGDAVSAQGAFTTAPAPGQIERLRLVFASCQQYEQGYYGAWRHAVADAPDLVVFLGDYIYESSWGRNLVRKHDPGVPHTLADYRRRHALYRSDADLQAAHAACAWLPTWDDHEVDNDYANNLSQRGDPPEQFLARRAAAYQAYFEHMPLPWSMAPKGPDMRIYGAFDWGALARLHVVDDRQYRAPQACSPPGHAGSRVVGPECLDRLDPTRTLLGHAQEAWLSQSMRDSRARWNVLAQQTLMSRADSKSGPGEAWWTDGWDGYPQARRRLLESVRQAKVANPLALGGDVHAFYAGELHEDFDRPAEKPAMIEFVGGAITSQSWPQARIDALVAENPNLRYGEGRFRGYGLMDIEPGRVQVSMRAIDDARVAATGVRTLRRFEVREGVGRLEG